MKDTPRWEHPCPNCKFIGRDKHIDCYYCHGPHDSPWRSYHTGPRLVINNRGVVGSITIGCADIYSTKYFLGTLICALKAKHITKEQADNIIHGGIE